MSELIGEIIDGRYQLTRVVGSGGMATIYAAIDLRLDRQVAVKVMHSHLAQDEQFVSRFIREAKAAASLSHPNIVAVLDQGWNQGGAPCVFIVMELIEGATLRDYIIEQGALSTERALSIITPVASALAAAHKLGIVHRDIKPENILVSKEGRIKIADFGLARGALLGNTMTAESSVILGSVSYLSPEQVQRGVADARSDIYSLGIVLFEILTGQKPYQGEDPVQVAIKHVNERVPAPSTIKPGLSIEIDQLVLSTTDIDPDKRPRDAVILLEKLRELSEKLDPRKRQLSLELDLPPLAIKGPGKKEGAKRLRRDKDREVEIPKNQEATVKKEKSSSIGKKALSKRVKRNRQIAALIAISLGIGIWYVIVGPGSKVIVPSLAGLTVKQATSELADLGLDLKVEREEFSEDIPEDRVINSSPAGGGRISPDGTVEVTISKGKERYIIPTLQGLKIEIAERLINDNKLVVGEVIEEFSSEFPKGFIMRSSPVAGERIKRDSQVTLYISKGIEQIGISSYQGKSGEQALNELTEAGFDVETKYVFSEDLPIGAVVSQLPRTGDIDKGSVITLTVSKGSEFVFIPNLFSLTQAMAVDTLKDLDLKVIIKKVGDKKIKVVTNISPKVGERVKRGSTVTITVG
ncbi:MAG: serine/threonine protein kinase [Actinobacteria bacterium BACL2 MAG-120802-bin41]|uniref:non-specific serine/threonine protein kinase n=2 Tax=ac1 cluster TaxID=1655545 RepID=A0A0R2NXP1_9ACTN|nr:MAG: serine/threonine protein kinase [Actinobacteria bacterium BACL2 MAG-120802-bin41]MDP4614819.1 Stk1 family PASTA domain-containing Ser/Thr kinase [Candidatus Nanopelagicales bacterium]